MMTSDKVLAWGVGAYALLLCLSAWSDANLPTRTQADKELSLALTQDAPNGLKTAYAAMVAEKGQAYADNVVRTALHGPDMGAVIVASLELWLMDNEPGLMRADSGLPLADPTIEYVSHDLLEKMTKVYSSDSTKVMGTCLHSTIYLDVRLDVVHDMPARSILLHELVHYLQGICEEAPLGSYVKEEEQARRIQNKWLGKHALDAGGKLKPSRWWKTNL